MGYDSGFLEAAWEIVGGGSPPALFCFVGNEKAAADAKRAGRLVL